MSLVFPEEQAVRLLRAAEEQDVASGGSSRPGRPACRSGASPGTATGAPGGSSVQLGRVEWTANAPTRAYITIHRCLVTRAGRDLGMEPADLLKRVLDPAGLPSDGGHAHLAGAEGR